MAFEWDDLLRFCLLILKLAPHQIWALTFKEILRCSRALQPNVSHAAREDLHLLMAEFPDR